MSNKFIRLIADFGKAGSATAWGKARADVDKTLSEVGYEPVGLCYKKYNFPFTLFEELNFGYRVLDKIIVPVTSEGEIKTIEEAIKTSEDNVSMHLHCSLEKLSERPKGDYRNSIKESISAVEAYCRNITGKDTLGNALAEMEHNGLNLPSSLKAAFLKLYGYTNSPDTGIRHPLMDVDGSYVPTADEATYMLVSCSAFINYLRKKSVA